MTSKGNVNTMSSFFVPLKKIPTVTHQQKRVRVVSGKPMFYEDDRLGQARELFMAHLSKHAPVEPTTGPVQLIVKWLYQKPVKAQSGQYKTSKPDLDNAQKLLQDCMTDLKFWNDDAQIASLVSEKFYSDVTGIYIEYRKLEE